MEPFPQRQRLASGRDLGISTAFAIRRNCRIRVSSNSGLPTVLLRDEAKVHAVLHKLKIGV
jgi:hypothetical protein